MLISSNRYRSIADRLRGTVVGMATTRIRISSVLGILLVIATMVGGMAQARADIISHCSKGNTLERAGESQQEGEVHGYPYFRQAATAYARCSDRESGRPHYVDMVFAAAAAMNAGIAAYRSGDPYRATFPHGNSHFLLRTARNVLNQVASAPRAPSDVKASARHFLALVKQALANDPTPDIP